MNPRRLYRCRHDRMLAGVAAGMAEYLGVDPTLVRVLWLVSILFGGLGILLYIVLAFVMPLEPAGTLEPSAAGAEGTPDEAAPAGAPTPGTTGSAPGQWPDHRHEHLRDRSSDPRGGRAGIVIGTLLVVFGAMALAHSVFPGSVVAAAIGPALIVGLGVLLVVGSARRPADVR